MQKASVVPGESRVGRGKGSKDRRALVGFALVLLHLPNYTRLAWGLLRDGQLSAGQRATVLAGIGYLALPIDLVPGIIPVAGQLDDLAAILLALRAVVRSLPPQERSRHLAAAELTSAAIDRDLLALGLTAVWLVGRVGGFLVRVLGDVAGGTARLAGSLFLNRGRT
jgi:uncharacterized membrane protein YkvA (DUF1232 family)